MRSGAWQAITGGGNTRYGNGGRASRICLKPKDIEKWHIQIKSKIRQALNSQDQSLKGLQCKIECYYVFGTYQGFDLIINKKDQAKFTKASQSLGISPKYKPQEDGLICLVLDGNILSKINNLPIINKRKSTASVTKALEASAKKDAPKTIVERKDDIEIKAAPSIQYIQDQTPESWKELLDGDWEERANHEDCIDQWKERAGISEDPKVVYFADGFMLRFNDKDECKKAYNQLQADLSADQVTLLNDALCRPCDSVKLDMIQVNIKTLSEFSKQLALASAPAVEPSDAAPAESAFRFR